MSHYTDVSEVFKDEINDDSINDKSVDNKLINEKYIITDKIISKKNNFIPWVEKYRPKRINDIIQQDEVIKVLNNTIESGELPHLLFFGPPGTGKTSTILAISMQLFGPKLIDDRVIELNASDDRGISIVRNKIISFAKHSLGSKDPRYPCPNFKIVILDEADAMTPEAQAALRTIMEKMSRITRFCFICNYDTQIIDPISSRCMKFRFKPICKKAIIKKLKIIAIKEQMNINDECISTLVDISEGDARRAIMGLQNLKYIINYKQKITKNDVIYISGEIEEHKFKNLWKKCVSGTINDIRNLTIYINRNGFSVKSIMSYLNKYVLVSNLTDQKKSLIALELCQTDKRLNDGSDQYIQIFNILLYINRLSKIINYN